VGTPSSGPDLCVDTRRLKSPTALRIVLGTQLRRLREARGVTVAAARKAIQGSGAKISRMELGRVGFRERDVLQLLTLYGVSGEQERQAFLTLVRLANVPGWWHQYSDLIPTWFEAYLGLEQASSVIRTYQPLLVPGLLQTPEVARTVVKLGHPGQSADDIERKVALRTTRQEILTQPDAPLLWAVFEEAALWRLNKNSIMHEQIQHLIGMSELPNVSIQIVPIYSRAQLGVGGPFTVLRFPHADLPDTVYLEQLTSAVYLDKTEDVQLYIMAMNRLCTEAATPTQTITLLNDTLKKL
jgi:Domain of unknown function (DUF5753)/Helix-turn-helix domain